MTQTVPVPARPDAGPVPVLELAGVTTGMYTNTMVQVSGSGITAGTLVEVPSS